MTEILQPLRDPILIVEDDAGTGLLVKNHLAEAGWNSVIVTTGQAALAWLAAHKTPLMLLDNSLPDMTGEELVGRQDQTLPPFIITTGAGSERLAVTLMKLGARDYLVKDAAFLQALRPAVTRVLKALETESKLADAEKLLRESEERYRSILNASPDVITITDLEGRILATSPVALAMFACAREEELLGQRILDFITPEDRERATSNIALMFQGVMTGVGEYVGLRSDGSTFNLEANGEFVRDAEGRPTHLVFVVRDITDRKAGEAEKAVLLDQLQREQLFSTSIIDSLPGVFFLYTYPECALVLCNKQHESIMGYGPGEMLGHHVSDWHAPADKAAVMNVVHAAMETGQGSLEASPLTKDGRSIPLFFSAVPFESQGKRYLMGTGIDITDRKRAEENLRESVKRYDSLVSQIPVGVYLIRSKPDNTFAFEYVSARMADLFGVELESLRADVRLAFRVVHPDDYDAFLKLNQDGLRNTVPFLWEGRVLVAGAVKWLHIEATPESLESGDVLWHGVVSDITDRMRAEEKLWIESAFLTDIINRNPLSIQVLDRGGFALSVNPAHTHLFQAVPPADYCLFRDPLLHKQGLGGRLQQMEAGQVVHFPEFYHNPHELYPEFPERPIWISMVGFPILGADGRPERYVLMHSDVTERRHAEEKNLILQAQLQQSQKMESLGVLAGGVAHDMNNVLAAILGMAELGSEGESDEKSRNYFKVILQAAERGGKMVKSLLSFARQSPIEDRELDLNVILREEVHLLERTTLAKVHLELDLETDLRPIRGDGGALTHAFMNLCVNAMDAMPVNGRLTLRTRNVNNEWVEVIVEDTGTGMSKEVLEKALDPFFTTKEVGKGTGLGLSMVYSTVKAHRGQLEIQSEPGQGTRVRMRFPASEAVALPLEPATDARSEPSAGGLAVLVVDDDPLIQSSMRAILETLGPGVTGVSSGEEALVKFETGPPPDVVILDMNMPGLGGAGTLPRLRALNPTVPVLLATGRVDQFASDLVNAHPHVSLLSKPFSIKDLQQHLEPLGHG